MQKLIEETQQETTLEETDISKWRDHVIICGMHNLGFRVAEQLKAAGVRLVVLDDEPDQRLARRARRMGIIIIAEDSRAPESLIEAGIYGASAVIACEENDLHNLETVLAANDLVRGIRTVASFFNQRIGEQITQALANARALSLSEKAGPSFVEACVPSSVLHFFTIQGEEMAVVEANYWDESIENSTIRKLYPRATPLVLKDSEEKVVREFPSQGNYSLARQRQNTNQRWEICPAIDHVIQAGDSFILAGRVVDLKNFPGVKLVDEDLLEAVSRTDEQDIEPGIRNFRRLKRLKSRIQRRQRLVQLRKYGSSILQDIDRPFRLALLFLVSVIGICSVIIWRTYQNNFMDAAGNRADFTLLDAIYFTVTIIATVGFGDYNFAQQEWELKIFGIFLMMVGAGTISVVYAYVTNFVISRRIEQAVGRQRATDMEGHVVICGLGTIGYQVMQGLVKQGQQVAIIEKNENGRFNSEARSLGVPIIHGDARLPQVLKSVNITKAKAIAIVTSDDLANLETALDAHAEFHKAEGNRRKNLEVVLRVFDKNLADRIARNFEIYNIYSASALAAPYFVGAALDYEVVTTFYLNRQPFIVAKMVVNAGSRLDNMSVGELYNTTGVLIMAHVEQDTVRKGEAIPAEQLKVRQLEPTFYPTRTFQLNPRDTIYFIAPYDKLLATHKLNMIHRT